MSSIAAIIRTRTSSAAYKNFTESRDGWANDFWLTQISSSFVTVATLCLLFFEVYNFGESMGLSKSIAHYVHGQALHIITWHTCPHWEGNSCPPPMDVVVELLVRALGTITSTVSLSGQIENCKIVLLILTQLTGWLGIRIMCLSGGTCLSSADCFFSVLAL